jgi:gliding motility-associated-like protein
MRGIIKIAGLFLLFFSFSTRLLATHNRAGEITYEHIEDLTYLFTITTYTDPTSLADRDELTIDWGDETTEVVLRSSIEILVPGKIQKNEYTAYHTYGGAYTYIVSMVDPNRVENILNIDGSVNVPFCLLDTVVIFDPLTYGFNSSPTLLYPPIDYANIGEWFIHNPGAFDPDGDSLSYELVVPLQYPGLVVPGYQYPDDRTNCTDTDAFTIDVYNGDVIWDVPSCQEGIYNIAILITEYRDGVRLGSILRDMEIFVEKTTNHAPEIAALNDTCIYAGEELNILVTATDPDVTQTITLSATGGPLFIDESPAEFFSTPNEGSVNGTFTWQTICNHIRSEVYSVVFKAEDDFQLGFEEIPLVDLETWLITVVAPPPIILDAVPTANEITITWQATYECAGADNFLGFSIWRKIGCDTTEFDKCQQGLDGTGYIQIGFVEDVYSFVDLGVSYGQQYAYRVVAEFGERSDLAPDFIYNEVASAPSDAICAELKRDLPIINHASVRTTSTTNGSVYVGWYNPLGTDLDTTIFLPPYKYELMRYEGFTATGTPVSIATFIAPTFYELTDTSYIDTLINTEDGAFTYQLDFYFTDGAVFEKLGKTDPASTVYLTVASGDNKLNLSWDFDVPWLNLKYDVFKETPTGSGNFEMLAATEATTYVDSNLINGENYCYYIKAYGQYTVATLPDTLINLSQIQCGVPVDNEPPCAPVLTVNNICADDENVVVDDDDLKNELSWTNPNNSCADDVVKYIIYYASQEGQQLGVLDQVVDPNDTSFTHEALLSLAGCYAIVAVDSFGNESALSNVVCVDNCSDYNLPNAFTPNGDGFNDLYTPRLPIRFIDHVDMKIFDRWGSLVFTTTDPMINWDGKDSATGIDVSEGVYYYKCDVFEITVNGVTAFPEPKDGYIHLVRQDKSE